MAISFVGSNGGNASASLTGLGLAAGDYIIVYAYKNSTTAPALASGYTNIANASGNSNSMRMAYKVATGSETTTGTFTNASALSVAIYRGVGSIGATGNNTKAANTSATVTGLTLQNTSGISWWVAGIGSRQTTNQGTPPAGPTTNRRYQAGTTAMSAIFDTNAGVSSATATTSSNNTSVVSAVVSIELKEPEFLSSLSDDFNNNSMDPKWAVYTSGTGSVTETNQQIEINSGTASGNYNGWESVSTAYDLTGSYAHVQAVDPGTPVANYNAYILQVAFNANNSHYWMLTNSGGTMVAQCWRVIGGTYTQVGSNRTHTNGDWYKIRESGGTIYYDYSTDGISWTNQTTTAVAFAITAVGVEIFTEVLGTITARVLKFDNFNIIPSGGGGSTGQMKVWNGSAWVAKPMKVWNGSSWVTKPVKRWNGSTWVVTPY